MNRYVVRDLKEYGDHFRVLKIRVFFPYFKLVKFHRYQKSTRDLGFFIAAKDDHSLYIFLPREAADQRNLELAVLAVQMCEKFYLNFALIGACQVGDRNFIKLIIDAGAYNWDSGLTGACRGQHRDLIKLMIKRGAYFCFNCKISAKKHPK